MLIELHWAGEVVVITSVPTRVNQLSSADLPKAESCTSCLSTMKRTARCTGVHATWN